MRGEPLEKLVLMLVLCACQAMEAEMAGRWPRCEQVCSVGQDLVNSGHEARSEIGARIKSLMDKWKQLQELAKSRRIKLDDAIEAQQVSDLALLILGQLVTL